MNLDIETMPTPDASVGGGGGGGGGYKALAQCQCTRGIPGAFCVRIHFDLYFRHSAILLKVALQSLCKRTYGCM